MFNNIKTIFFDYDGTLHDSIKIYAPAFRKSYEFLVEQGYAQPKKWTENEISYWLGFNSKDMWSHFMPFLGEEIKTKASQIIGREMTTQIEKGNAQLYPGAIEILSYLKNKAYHLVFISNCGIYYRDIARDHFRLDEYFEDMICSEEYAFIPKYEIVGKIIDKYPQDMIIIGDRKQDIDAGTYNHIYTIGCSYGFPREHELDNADLIINDIRELRNIL